MFICIGSIIQTTIIWTEMEYHTIVTLVLSFIYTIIIVPVFVWISGNVREEHLNEAKLVYFEKAQFKRMFDGLQEGVVVMQGGAISFMNELSNRVLTEIAGLGNFYKNKELTGDRAVISPIDRKLFYLFE